MKRIVLAVLIALVALSSCRKQEPEVDVYGGPATLYRVGDPFEASSLRLYFKSGNKEHSLSYLEVTFIDNNTKNDSYELSALMPYTGPLKKGDVYNPSEFSLWKNLRNLGYSTIESGRIVYMGEEDGKAIVRFEDAKFTITRSDGLGGTFFIRGTIISRNRGVEQGG